MPLVSELSVNQEPRGNERKGAAKLRALAPLLLIYTAANAGMSRNTSVSFCRS